MSTPDQEVFQRHYEEALEQFGNERFARLVAEAEVKKAALRKKQGNVSDPAELERVRQKMPEARESFVNIYGPALRRLARQMYDGDPN